MKPIILLLVSAAAGWAQWTAVPSTAYPALEAILNAKPATTSGAGAPTSACTAGKDIYLDTAALTLYDCVATGNPGTWVQRVMVTGSFTNPSFIASLAWSKLTGVPSFAPATTGTVPLKGNGSGGFANVLAADVVSLFSGCTGTQYLGADDACHTASGSSPVASVFGRTGAVTAANGDYTTTQVTEGTNQYFTAARAQAAMAGLYQTPLSVTATPTANAVPQAGAGGTLAAAWIPILNQPTTANAGTATALAGTPIPCATGYAATGVLASGNSTGCQPVTQAMPTTNLVAAYPLTEGMGGYAYNYASPPLPNYNMIGPSEQEFNTSTSNGPVPWTAPGMTLTDGYAANPNGDFVASRLQATGTGGYLTPAKQPPFVTGRQYTISIYAASNTGAAQTFRMSDNNVNYGPNITVPATGWARYSYTFTSTSTGNGYAIPVAQDAANDHLDLLVWGAQLEMGAHPTSYYNPNYTMVNGAGPQQTASACSWVAAGIDCTTVCASNYCGWMQAAGWQPIDLSAVTAYAVVKSTTTEVLAGYAPIVNDNYLSNPQFWLAGAVNGTTFPGLRFGTSSSSFAYGANVVDGNWHVLVGSYDGSNNITLYIDGYLAQTWAVGALAPIQFSQLFISNFGGAGFWPGQIGYVAVYRVAHTQAQIVANTTILDSIMATRGVTIPLLQKAMVFEGDSITDPTVSMAPNLKYSALAQAAITPFPEGSNFAISGSGIANITARSAAVDAAFATPSLTEKLLFLFDGANDMGLGASTLVADLKAYCLARKAASPGLKIVIATLLPQTTSGFNTFRDAVNPLIKADNSWYDAIADFAADPTMGCDACAGNTTYFSDGEHPTAAGQAILGPIARAAIQTIW